MKLRSLRMNVLTISNLSATLYSRRRAPESRLSVEQRMFGTSLSPRHSCLHDILLTLQFSIAGIPARIPTTFACMPISFEPEIASSGEGILHLYGNGSRSDYLLPLHPQMEKKISPSDSPRMA